MQRWTLFVAIFAGMMSANAFAWPPTYGFELEFVTKEIVKNWHNLGDERADGYKYVFENRALEQMRNAVKKMCANSKCKVIEDVHKGRYAFKVTYEDGFWFRISTDPGCVEIQTKPSTLEELRKYETRIDRDIFGVAEKAGLFPDDELDTGMGHFNFGIRSTFGDDLELFLRHYVDFANHPELALGVLGEDQANAPPLSIVSQEQRDNLSKLVAEVRDPKGEIKTIERLAYLIQNRVHIKSPSGLAGYHNQAYGIKYTNHAGFLKNGEDAPGEWRAVFLQTSALDLILLAELHELRVGFLKKRQDPLVYLGRTQKNFTEQQLVSRYYKYVVEAGGDWERLSKLMRQDLWDVKPLGILTGDINWDDGKFVEGARFFMDDIGSSLWVRRRMLKALRDPRAAASPAAFDFVIELIKRTEALRADPNYKKSVRNVNQFLKDVAVSWKEQGKIDPLSELDLACTRSGWKGALQALKARGQ